MARLYADENFPQPAVERLRELGHDVQTVQDAGKAQQKLPDEAVLAEACADGRAVVTHNRKDFRHLHAAPPDHRPTGPLLNRLEAQTADLVHIQAFKAD